MYGDSVTRSRIIDGTTKLGDFRTRMEKYFMDNRTYLGAGGALRRAMPRSTVLTYNAEGAAPATRRRGHPTTYTVTATGVAARGMAGFTYHDQSGQREDLGRSRRQVHERRLLGRAQGRVVLMPHRAPAGFTLVELMIGLAIAALLSCSRCRATSVWIADAQIRNAAESIASGMRFAQSQAVTRNSTVEFVLDPIVGTGGWTRSRSTA